MKNQFVTLQNWTQEVLHEIKKDIKNEHLASAPAFYRTYFGNRPQNRLTTEEIVAAYEKELINNNEELAEWVVNRWVFKHGDLYQHFAERLSQVNPDFDQIQQLTDLETETVLAGAIESFGAIPTFLFAVLNGVVFPEAAIERLRKAATAAKASQNREEAAAVEKENLDKILAAHQREVARLNDKIVGVQKKYQTDTDALKKQIRILQKKLDGR